jgi:phosphinothricin acetyltransferase
MNYTIRRAAQEDKTAILAIYNVFVRESFAAYSEEEVGEDFFNSAFQSATIFLILEWGKMTVGFGYIKPFRPSASFSHTGLLTYFILPEHTGKGLGTQLYTEMIHQARSHGVTNLIAHISSKNEQSLAFHRKLGFKICGCMESVGEKFGERFDMIWVQKQLDND